MDLTDVELMLAFGRRGDRKAFAELVKRHQRSLLNFFYRLVWRRDLAEDFTQEVFIRLMHAAKDYTPQAKFTTFLYRLAKNLWIEKVREYKSKRVAISLDNPIGADKETRLKEVVNGRYQRPEEPVIKEDEVMKAKRIMTRLPEDQRLILNLSLFQGMSYPEIARVLDIPVGTVKSRAFAAIMKIKEMM